MKVKFIKPEYLKKNSAISGDVDDDILEPYIFKAQEVYIHRILGTALYTKLKADVTAGSVTGIYLTILNDYVCPALLEYATYEALPFVYLKLTNKSVSKRDSEFSTSADLSEVKWLRSTVLDISEYQAQRLTDYLKTNIALITEYQNPGSTIDTIRPSSTSYFGGVYLGNGGRDCSWGEGR